MQGRFNVGKFVNLIQHINRGKDKKKSQQIEKAFDKIQHLFIIKVLKKLGVNGSYLNIINALYNKPIQSIILNRGHQTHSL
jgi:hypothetical protein